MKKVNLIEVLTYVQQETSEQFMKDRTVKEELIWLKQNPWWGVGKKYKSFLQTQDPRINLETVLKRLKNE